jgi:hypothetical protein
VIVCESRSAVLLEFSRHFITQTLRPEACSLLVTPSRHSVAGNADKGGTSDWAPTTPSDTLGEKGRKYMSIDESTYRPAE